MLETGSVAQERYRIVRLLGQGGMGSVYRAWDLRLKVPVALKELLPQPGLDTEMLGGLREQFEQEAGVLARLNHPHLVRVTDFFEEQDRAYLVMDFVEGRSLADVIVQDGAQPESKVLGWGRQLLEALDYCHTHGVVHRDIKPQNIIVKPDGAIVLVDFGLVKLWDPNDPRTRTVMRGMGTPEYAPPEQYGAGTDHTGPASDIYSLGATLYHLLTGQAPPTATERMAMPEQFRPIRQLVPTVSSRAETLVMKALALSVGERWQTARQMLEALVSGPLPTPDQGTLPKTRVAPAPSMGRVPRTRATELAGQAPAPYATGDASLPPSRPATTGGMAARQRPKGLWLGFAGLALLCVALTCGGYLIGKPILEGMRWPTDTPPAPPTEQVALITPTSPPEVMPSPTTKPDMAGPESESFTVNVANWSPYEVCYVYISPSDSDSWGEDWLGSDETIPTGEPRAFDVAAGSYDLMVRACDRAILATEWKFNSERSVTVSQPGFAPIRVTNDTDQDICYFYISPEASDSWGDDLMGSHEVLGVDETRVFFIHPGSVDLMAQDCEGITLAEQYGLNVQAETFWSISEGRITP
ncbi:MAG: protein kinase [Anaerolineae bacterium]|nr:protein kinase [Anaerolineae bacterium]